jgi:hypothetical protein
VSYYGFRGHYRNCLQQIEAISTFPFPSCFSAKKIMGAGGMAQAVECLPSRCEVLNSNPSTTKKKDYGAKQFISAPEFV